MALKLSIEFGVNVPPPRRHRRDSIDARQPSSKTSTLSSRFLAHISCTAINSSIQIRIDNQKCKLNLYCHHNPLNRRCMIWMFLSHGLNTYYPKLRLLRLIDGYIILLRFFCLSFFPHFLLHPHPLTASETIHFP